jgi:[ribosomal protein S18]-alanine N-acetyltransferase
MEARRMTLPPCALEAATDDDVAALVALERLCFSHPWTARNFRDAMADPARGLVLVLRGPAARGEPGRGLLAYCSFQTVVDEMHIHNLAVDPARQGRGLGHTLLALSLAVGARRGAERALLEVRQSNWAAQRLYRSLGFQGVAVRRGYYSHPAEDALVLEKRNLAAGGRTPA